jgi:transcriptional regulator
MYIPQHFQESRTEVLHELIKEHPFGILVTNGESGMDANHIPFELDIKCGEFGTLHAHVARANPLWKDVQNGDEVLAIFQAEHAYISPTWYPSKHESHKQVPTWNYMVVHARGKVLIHDDERYVRGMVARLTRTHEADQPQPWKMTDSPKDFIDMMLKNIVGIEIPITQLVGKFKLGQNRETRDIKGAGEALKAQGDILLGQAMLDRVSADPEK